MQKKLFLNFIVISFFIFTQNLCVVPHTNIFNPYDILVRSPMRSDACWQLDFGYERAVKVCAYQADEDERGNSNCFRKKAPLLQLWQCEQDGMAALKGEDFDTVRGELIQRFNIDEDNGTHGLFIPCADLDINNFMFSLRYYLCENFAFSLHLPVIQMDLHNVTWTKSPKNTNETFEDQLVEDFISELETVGGLNLRDCKRTGLGDLACLLWWARCFEQARPILRRVALNARIGLTLPTGKKSCEDTLLGLPLGNDGGFGILGGMGLDLYFCEIVRAGLDVELHYFFGDNKLRRIKTDVSQTDLLLLQKQDTYVYPGFIQHFTLYGDIMPFECDFYGRIAYQYTKQDESRLYVCNDHFDSVIANTAEKLDDWTTHHLVFSLNYDCACHNISYRPYFSIFYKWGFNGQRAMVMNTVGGVLGFDF